MIQLQNLSGAKAHRWQRISAWYLFLYLPAMAVYITQLPENHSLENIIGNLSHSLFGMASVIALFFAFIHAWIGGRDILIDYTPRSNSNFWLNLYFGLLILVAADLTFMVISLNA